MDNVVVVAALFVGAFLVGVVIQRRNSWLASILLGAFLMALFNYVLRGMGFWYFGEYFGEPEPLVAEVAWMALHVPVIWYIRSAPGQRIPLHLRQG